MENSKKGMLPMITGKSLSKAQHPQTDEEQHYMSKVPFSSAIGSIIYSMICTRPDVSFDVSATSRNQSGPRKEYSVAVKRNLST
jgi:ATP-binding cassette subfamily B (MDR/TAP) protein 1